MNSITINTFRYSTRSEQSERESPRENQRYRDRKGQYEITRCIHCIDDCFLFRTKNINTRRPTEPELQGIGNSKETSCEIVIIADYA